MYDIPIKQKKSTKLTLKEEENRLELIKKENVDKIHDILINSKNLYEDLIILYPNLKGNKHLMMARTINDLYRNKSLQNILFGEEFDSIIDLKNNLFKKRVENIEATGGTIIEITDNNQRYRVHTFTSSGNFEILSGNGEVEYLIVAGGGGAAGYNSSGGGGAGGYRSNVKGELSGGNSQPESPMFMNKGNYSVIVGAGGIGTAPTNYKANNGYDSSFNNIISLGGGAGNADALGISGGSGGGIRPYPATTTFGSGTINQGNDSGIHTSSHYTTGCGYPGSGGGGAGTKGGDTICGIAGKGGDGLQSKINGTLTYYAGGGGGSCQGGYTSNIGGLGGGGNAGSGSSGNFIGFDGLSNTGGGGGAGNSAKGGNGGSGIVIIRYPIDNNPDNHIVNSHTDIIGVQDDGTRSSNGAGLRQVMFNNSKLDLTTKDTAYFDNHRSYRFSDYYDTTGNVFVKIPISYWWRGMLPDVVDGTTPRWTMLLSPYPITKTINGVSCTFAASPDTFNHNTKGWLPHFYIGKYRGSNDGTGTKVASKQGAAHWGNVSFDNCRTYCSNNGTDYHMLSLFEWHEILGRMTIEKATFQLMPEAIRATQASCVYRGINDFCYGGTIYAEWMNGIRTDANGKYEMWNQAQGSYISTNNNCFEYTTAELTYYAQSIYNNMDNLFISDIGGPNSTCMIPDLVGMRPVNYVSKVCDIDFHSSSVFNGAFHIHFYHASSVVHAAVGCRLAKY